MRTPRRCCLRRLVNELYCLLVGSSAANNTQKTCFSLIIFPSLLQEFPVFTWVGLSIYLESVDQLGMFTLLSLAASIRLGHKWESFTKFEVALKTPAICVAEWRAISYEPVVSVRCRMPAITFSRRHYRFAARVALFFVASGLVLVFVLRKGDVVNRVNIEAPAAWIKDSLANLPIYQEDSRDFWQVIHHFRYFPQGMLV